MVAEARRAAQQRIEALMQMQKAKPSIPVAVGGKRRDEMEPAAGALPRAASPVPVSAQMQSAPPVQPAQVPPPARNWRATAAPVVAVKKDNKVAVLTKTEGPTEKSAGESPSTHIAVASSSATIIAGSTEPSPRKTASGLDLLIRSVRRAVEMHAQPAPDIHGNVPGAEAEVKTEPPEPQRVAIQKRAPSLGAISTATTTHDEEEGDGRPLLIRMHPGDQVVKSHLTIKQQHSAPPPRRTTPPRTSRSRQDDLSRMSLSGLTG